MAYSGARAYCAGSRCGWGLFGHFYSIYPFSPLSPSLWETVRYRLKYCLKGPLNPKQPTNQHTDITCNTEKPPQQYRFATVSNKVLGAKRVLLYPTVVISDINIFLPILFFVMSGLHLTPLTIYQYQVLRL